MTAIGPGDQFLAVLGRARAQEVELARGGEQRVVARASPRRAANRADPRARRAPRSRPRCGLPSADDLLEHQRAIGEQRAAGFGDDSRCADSVSASTRSTSRRELERLARRDRVAVHDMQRIARLPHVQPGERAPRAADRVEGRARAACRARGTRVSACLHDLLGLLERSAEASCSAGRRAAA